MEWVKSLIGLKKIKKQLAQKKYFPQTETNLSRLMDSLDFREGKVLELIQGLNTVRLLIRGDKSLQTKD